MSCHECPPWQKFVVTPLACSFCKEADKSLGHIFVTCHYTKKVIKWMRNQDIEIELLSNKTHNVWYLSKRPKLSMYVL